MQTHALPPAEPVAGDRDRPARPGRAAPAPESARPVTEPGDELPAGLGDVIDDRVAEVVDELLGQRGTPRPGPGPRLALAGLALFLAAAMSVMLRHDVIAVCLIWPCTAAVYLTATRFARASRP